MNSNEAMTAPSEYGDANPEDALREYYADGASYEQREAFLAGYRAALAAPSVAPPQPGWGVVVAKIVQAQHMVRDLCKPKGEPGAREWIMSIPARPDSDPDLVISAALYAAREYITAAAPLQEPAAPPAQSTEPDLTLALHKLAMARDGAERLEHGVVAWILTHEEAAAMARLLAAAPSQSQPAAPQPETREPELTQPVPLETLSAMREGWNAALRASAPEGESNTSDRVTRITPTTNDHVEIRAEGVSEERERIENIVKDAINEYEESNLARYHSIAARAADRILALRASAPSDEERT